MKDTGLTSAAATSAIIKGANERETKSLKCNEQDGEEMGRILGLN